MTTSAYDYPNRTFNTTVDNSQNISRSVDDVMKILQVIIASLGITANSIVVFVFLNHKKLRRKLPNICIINQVSIIKHTIYLYYLSR